MKNFEQDIALLYEQQVKDKDASDAMQEFAQKRLSGAEKIAKNAKEKGGAAMLTYHHFNVKLPHYKKMVAGEFDAEAAKKQLKTLTQQLDDAIDGRVEMQQIEFQKNMGIIEVLGELLIQMQKSN